MPSPPRTASRPRTTSSRRVPPSSAAASLARRKRGSGISTVVRMCAYLCMCRDCQASFLKKCPGIDGDCSGVLRRPGFSDLVIALRPSLKDRHPSEPMATISRGRPNRANPTTRGSAPTCGPAPSSCTSANSPTGSRAASRSGRAGPGRSFRPRAITHCPGRSFREHRSRERPGHLPRTQRLDPAPPRRRAYDPRLTPVILTARGTSATAKATSEIGGSIAGHPSGFNQPESPITRTCPAASARQK